MALQELEIFILISRDGPRLNAERALLSVAPTPMPTLEPTLCSPRPNIARVSKMTPSGLEVTLTAATNSNISENPINKIDFTSFSNGTVTVVNRTYTSVSSHSFGAGVPTTQLLIKQVTKGQPTTIGMKVYDRCGAYPLFFGGGVSAGWPTN